MIPLSSKNGIRSLLALLVIIFSSSYIIIPSDLLGEVAPVDRSNVGIIKVGNNPEGIAVDPTTHKVDVTNYLSNTTSVIDSKTNDLVVTVTFNVNPVDSGQITCSEEQKEISTNIPIRFKAGDICKGESQLNPEKFVYFGR